jgi:ribosomal protein S14
VTAARHRHDRQRDYIPRMLRRALLPCLVVLLAMAATAGARPVAHAAKSCSLSSAEHGGSKPSTLGTTYVLSLSARHVSCGKAKGVVKAFHACRHKHGKAGHCGSVKGYKCSENRTKGVTQYDSTATCKKGRKKVVHQYTQRT